MRCPHKINPETVVRRFSFKKSILKKFPAQEIFKNTFFTEHLRVAASGTKNTLLKKYSRQLKFAKSTKQSSRMMVFNFNR